MASHPAPQRSATQRTEPPDAASAWRPGLTPVTLTLVLLAAYLLVEIRLVVILALLALLYATVIERPVQQLERRHVPRSLAILLIDVAFVAGLALPVVLLAPAVGREGARFAREAPAQLRALDASWSASPNPLLSGPGHRLLAKGIATAEARPVPRGAAVSVLTGGITAVVGALSCFVIAFYYLRERALLRRLVLDAVHPGGRARVARVWDEVETKVGSWMRGQLLLGLIIGVSATITYGLLGLRYWSLLGLLAGVTELVPILGPWVAGVTTAIFALTESWQKALLVVVFILLRQAVVDVVLVPRIMKGAVGLSPLTVFVAILTGTEFLGPPGALLAIPVAAAIQVIIADILGVRREAARAAGLATRWSWWHLTVSGDASAVTRGGSDAEPP